MQIDDLRLLGIPRSRLIIAIIYPYHDAHLKDCPGLSAKVKLAECISVARVRPRTSKGITDLLLLNLVRLDAASPSKKNFPRSEGRGNYLAGQSLVRYRN